MKKFTEWWFEKYPEALKEEEERKREGWRCISLPSYEQIMEWIGEVIHEQTDSDYQGDTFAILKRDKEYAYLCFGWGSCSGCDALQACDSWHEVDELAEQLANVEWKSKDDLITWLKSHDWAGDYDADKKKAFALDALRVLELV